MDSMEIEIKSFITEELLDNHLDITSATSLFKDQGLDSMDLTQLICFLEEKYAIKVGSMDIVYENLDTIENMIAFVKRKKR